MARTREAEVVAQEVVAQENVNTPAGIFHNCFRINVQVNQAYEDNYAIWLAKNVGPVKMITISKSDGEIKSNIVLKHFFTFYSLSDEL